MFPQPPPTAHEISIDRDPHTRKIPISLDRRISMIPCGLDRRMTYDPRRPRSVRIHPRSGTPDSAARRPRAARRATADFNLNPPRRAIERPSRFG
jgi:hypothetical protein